MKATRKPPSEPGVTITIHQKTKEAVDLKFPGIDVDRVIVALLDFHEGTWPFYQLLMEMVRSK